MSSPKFNILSHQIKQKKNQTIVSNKAKKTSMYLPSGQYDIYAIAENVRDALTENKKRMDEIVQRLKKLELIIQLNPSEEDLAKEEIFYLNREFRQLKEITRLEEFEKDSKKILDEYRKSHNVVEDDFFGVGSSSPENNKYIDVLIDRMVCLAKRYITIPPKKYFIIDPAACECGSKTWDNSTEGGSICTNCGLTVDLIDGNIQNRNGKAVKNTNKNYSLDKHLLEAMTQLECKQNKEIGEDILEPIYKEMNKKDITPDKLTKTKLHRILQYIGYNDYQDVHKIHYEITGKPPVHVSQWSNEIMQDHTLYQRMYDRVKPPEKSNAQNKFYKLLRMLLRREGFVPYKDDWFMIEEKIQLYEEDTEEIYNRLGWEYHPIDFNDFK